MAQVLVAAQYRDVIRALTPIAKARCYKLTGTTFSRQSAEGNWTLVNFQKGTKSSSDQVVFTLNIGAYSQRIARFEGFRSASRPKSGECHLDLRIGFLLPERQDRWWVIDRETDVRHLVESLSRILEENAFPLLDAVKSDAGHRDFLLDTTEPYPDLPTPLRLRYASILVSELGPSDRLPALLDELRRIASRSAGAAPGIDHHLAKLGHRR